MSAPIRISDLMERLQEWHERYGDCPVYVEDAASGWTTEVEAVDFAPGSGVVCLRIETGWDE